jgi:hypothetical protein
VKRLFRRIKLARQRHVRGGEVLNGFWILDNPDCLIIVGYKDSSLGFPFWVTDRSASSPAFLHAIRAAGLRVFGRTSLVADPTGARSVLLLGRDGAERREAANKREKESNPPPVHLFPPARATRLRGCPIDTVVHSLTGCDNPHA